MSEEEEIPIVIDNGTFMTKAGLAGADKPCMEFQPLVGRGRICGMVGMNIPDFYIGDQALRKQGILRIKRPIKDGQIDNWDDMEKIWHHTFYNELKIQPEEHPIFVSDIYYHNADGTTYGSRRIQREKMTQIMFETFNAPSFYVEDQGVLALYASGKSTGMVIDFGYETTRIAPVYEGHILKDGYNKLNIGGITIDECLQNLLVDKGYTFKFPNRNFKVDAAITIIKEKYGYVSLDFEAETAEEVKYEMPDGNVIIVGSERFKCAEILFQPELIQNDDKDLKEYILDSFSSIEDQELKTKMMDNIILNGGGSLLPNLSKRLQNEMGKTDFKIIDSQERNHSVWNGGSILASMASFSEKWIDKEEFDEYGPETVHFRCF